MVNKEKLRKLADIMIDHSVSLRKNETIHIIGYGFDSYPLVKEVYKKAVTKGAKKVKVDFNTSELSRIFYEESTQEQREYIAYFEKEIAEYYDCRIQIVADGNPYELSGVPTKHIEEMQRAHKPLSDIVINKKWCLFYYPTEASSMLAKKPMEEWEDFVFDSCILDWKKEEIKQNKFKSIIETVKRVRITGEKTDITLDITNQPWKICVGNHNLPDGEVYSSPIKDNVNGVIRYNTPTIYRSHEFNWVSLEFKNGKVISMDSDNKSALEEILDADEGAKYIGEFAFGLNPNISEPTKQILFDEKMNKSIHTALGRCYEETPNGNDSIIHWDLIFRFAPAKAKVFFDKELVYDTDSWVRNDLYFLN